jgi:hypothetical protein
MNALFLKDLAKKTHRGLRGRVEKGFSAGAVGYGYRMVRRLTSEGELVRGEREVDPAQALIVSASSASSRRARARGHCCDLNADGIAGPTRKPWRDTSIRGDVRRGSGIINNELYVGVRVWNHKQGIKNPNSGKTVTRLNPESEWVRVEASDLRIVSDVLWEAAKRQQQAPSAIPGSRSGADKEPERGASSRLSVLGAARMRRVAEPMPSSWATAMAVSGVTAATPAPMHERSGAPS